MTMVTAYEARTHLPRLLRAAERGETVIITRHGKPVAQLGPVQDRRPEEISAVIEQMKRARAKRPKVSLEEILAWRHGGHKYYAQDPHLRNFFRLGTSVTGTNGVLSFAEHLFCRGLR